MADFTCPFCMRDYPKSKVLYVCPDCHEPTRPKALERVVKCRNVVGGRQCPGSATQRQCPFCRDNNKNAGFIPKDALETPNLPFSIVGVSGAGKTNYITVMLRELGHAASLRLALSYQNPQTRAIQQEAVETLYEQHYLLPPTALGEKRPQIWKISNLNKRQGNTVPTYTFTIFDGAGEDHEQRVDQSSTVCRYINASRAIMLVIDPLVLSEVRNDSSMDPTVMRNSLAGGQGEARGAADVINGVVNYIKESRQIRTDQILKIPVAVVLTKFDTLVNHPAFGPQALVRQESQSVQSGRVSMGEIDQVDGEIRNWLWQIGEGSFIGTMESSFHEFRFFGVSSLGAPPPGGGRAPDPIRPHRVLDPLLWLFHKENFVD